MKNYSGQTRWRYYCSYSCPACHIKHSFFRLAVDDCNDYLPDNFFLLSYIKKAFREHFEFKELSCYIVNEQDLFFFRGSQYALDFGICFCTPCFCVWELFLAAMDLTIVSSRAPL